MGFTLGYSPPYSVMKRFVDYRWKELGQVEIISLRNGVFIFKFENEESKLRDLESSPLSLASKMLYLRPWTLNLDIKKRGFGGNSSLGSSPTFETSLLY